MNFRRWLKSRKTKPNEHELRIEKKYCNNKHHTGSIINIFFQSSSLDQKDYEISCLIRTKEIILIIVEWPIFVSMIGWFVHKSLVFHHPNFQKCFQQDPQVQDYLIFSPLDLLLLGLGLVVTISGKLMHLYCILSAACKSSGQCSGQLKLVPA